MTSRSRYTYGYLTSIILTSLAFWSVIDEWFYGWSLAGFLLALASIQLIVQLVLFLHIGDEKKPRWNIYALIFMVLSLLFFVLGSLWIMKNLNYNMMPENVDEYLLEEEGIKK